MSVVFLLFVMRDLIVCFGRERVLVWRSVGNLHHVEIHQAGVLVLVTLRQVQEPVALIEWDGREVGIDGDKAEGGI